MSDRHKEHTYPDGGVFVLRLLLVQQHAIR